jgi:hypothetical protein
VSASSLSFWIAGARAVAAVTSMLVGVAALCVGAFLAFPLVISVLLWAIGLRPNSFAYIAMAAALLLEVIGLGLILLGPHLWPRLGGHAKD